MFNLAIYAPKNVNLAEAALRNSRTGSGIGSTI